MTNEQKNFWNDEQWRKHWGVDFDEYEEEPTADDIPDAPEDE